MSPAPGDRTANRRPFLIPFLLGLCSLILVREGLQKLVPGISYWIVFLAGLAVGWGVFTVVERVLAQRNASKREGLQ
jgi:hypothetical protein